MFRTSVRRFATSACRAAANDALAQAERVNAYGLKVSTAQGTVDGLVGGMFICRFLVSVLNLRLLPPCLDSLTQYLVPIRISKVQTKPKRTN